MAAFPCPILSPVYEMLQQTVIFGCRRKILRGFLGLKVSIQLPHSECQMILQDFYSAVDKINFFRKKTALTKQVRVKRISGLKKEEVRAGHWKGEQREEKNA